MREGWEKITMLEACDLITCGVAARPKYVDEGVPFLSAKNVKEGKIIYEGFNCITEENHQELTKKNKPLVGDILYTRVGSYGEAAVIEEDIEFSVFVSLTLIKPKKELLNSYFLKYYLNSHEVKTLAKNSITSSGVGNLNVGTVRKFPIPIPPLQEQKQIVALLDKAFTAIDQAKANIEKNIANAKELFQSKLNDIFSQKGAGWEEKTLNEICEVKDGTHDSPKYIDEEFGIPFVTQKNILDDGISFEKTKFISEEDHNNFYRRSNVAYNDILFAMIGANRGMACIVDDKRVFSIKNVGLIKSNESYRAKFILYFLKSPRAKKYVAENSSGSAQGFIGLTKLRAFPVPFTSIENQKEIELLIESLNNSIKATISNYTSKLNSLEELKKSILQKAFAGELTNQSVVGSNEFAVNIE